jgi:hypothetical protein
MGKDTTGTYELIRFGVNGSHGNLRTSAGVEFHYLANNGPSEPAVYRDSFGPLPIDKWFPYGPRYEHLIEVSGNDTVIIIERTRNQ